MAQPKAHVRRQINPLSVRIIENLIQPDQMGQITICLSRQIAAQMAPIPVQKFAVQTKRAKSVGTHCVWRKDEPCVRLSLGKPTHDAG